ncbi:hypothetical protein Ahy_A06g029995 [Arachis hypogaea]|uniref:SWIM-type domain-containing protein n=1 Tax=Arachis hypogaea TaxID=3818 RepID=A0A445CUU9_ARAHY|nr:hypothetical protein Ahy_A06g029995 [Arachis hypogaea]
MSINEDDVKNDFDNDLGDDFYYQSNAEDDAEDDDVDSLDSTSKSEEVCGVKRIADLMDDVVRDNQGRIISRQLVCNKEGWRNMRYLDLDDRSREARSLTRTKCPAQLRVKLDYGYGIWKRDFDRRWAAILDKHNLVGSTWMEKTYETRAMWSHCFLQDKFFGYIRTTSQCEGINSLIRFYVNRKNTLIDFMHNLDRALKEYRNNELIADFKSQFSEPVIITLLEEIRNEIQRARALNIKVLSITLDKVEFSVTALGDPAKDRQVEVDRGKNLFSCSCKLFESRGILCSHVFCAMKFENILEFPDSLIYKRWTKNTKNEFISTEMPVNDDIERVLKFRVGALASNCNKLCDIACKDLADFDEVQSELVNLVTACSHANKASQLLMLTWKASTIPLLSKAKEPLPRGLLGGRREHALIATSTHSVEGNPRDRSDDNASAKDSGFSPERFANSSRSILVKSKHHSGPKTKPFKKGRTRNFTAMGMRNRKGKDNTFDERSLHESSESIDVASMNGFFNKNLYLLTQTVKESQQDKRHSFTNYECVNDVIDEKCDTPHVQIDV